MSEDILGDLFKDFPPMKPEPKKAPVKTGATKKVTPKPEATEPAPAPAESLAPVKVKMGGKVAKQLAEIEQRFLEVAGLTGELDSFPISQENHLQVKTDKTKSDAHGEVFTPLWLVDDMIMRIDDKSLESQRLTTRDLCSGYGQFTVRLMRKKYQVLGERYNIRKFLEETHSFVELQPNSCYRLLYIFGTDIRLCMGDATKLGELPEDAEGGIWVQCEGKWKDYTKKVTERFNKIEEGKSHGKKSIAEKASHFEELIERIRQGA